MTEGLKTVGAKIHGRLDEIAREAPKPGDGVVVDHHDAEGGVAENDGPDREIDAHDVEGGAQRYTGDDAGKRDRQNEKQRDGLAAEELSARERGGCESAEDEREKRGYGGNLEREIERRPDVRALRPGDPKPFHRVAGRRKLEALLLGGEGVKKDQGQGQMQEQKPGNSRDAKPCRSGAVLLRGHRTPPCASPPTDRFP